ncbi:MAG: ATP-binding protein [Simkaniaceae bacterium]|nr:ATP-binding protein [Simkaniaceae bacterium]
MERPAHTVSSTFKAELATLRSMLTWVREHIEHTSFDKMRKRHVELAMEETLVNIIYYAYQPGEGMVELTCSVCPDKYIELVVKDYGKPFNPLEQVTGEPDRHASLEEREPGGLGILFIKKFMDKIEYVRKGDANILTLRKEKGQE